MFSVTHFASCALRILLVTVVVVSANASIADDRPNIVTVFIDDMGFTDLSCFGGEKAQTANIDRLAAGGIQFTNFYVNSPICSPSRTALTTGQYPQRWRITSFLNNRKNNIERGVAQWLDPAAPVLARQLKTTGYYTGHFGKWHMGGQRDVGEAPLISDYGFDHSLTNFEGLGPRVLGYKDAFKGGKPKLHSLGSNDLDRGPIEYADRSVITTKFVDRALKHIDEAVRNDQPFFVNVWPDDVHSPFFPPEVLRDGTDESKRQLYYAVLEAMDQQLAPLFDRIANDSTLHDNTLILLCSDNGHEQGAGMSTPLRAGKCYLYEGGIRSPLIVWGPGFMDQAAVGTKNETSVFSAIDINRSLYEFTRTSLRDDVELDGENVIETMLGKSTDGRKAPLLFRRPPDRPDIPYRWVKTEEQPTRPPNEDAPDLAIRDGKWKFLINYDGSDPQLYDLGTDVSETKNLVEQHPEIAERLQKLIFDWNAEMPRDAGDPLYKASNDVASAPEVVDQWRYQIRRPGNAWASPEFNDERWIKGQGGFGTRNTPNARVGTVWNTDRIWLRKVIELASIPQQPALWMHHDDDVQVFINGQLTISKKGYSTDYEMTPLTSEHASALRVGRNTIAIACVQHHGGQFIDAHLCSVNQPPELPAPPPNIKPFESDLITRWGADVTADNAWTEYPRPQLKRGDWKNLNGQWDYCVTKDSQTETPQKWDGEILVPFGIESKLSGVQRLLLPSEALWYRRSFEHSAKPDTRQFMNFEAVDYACEVWVNGTSVGKHTGGCTPFAIEVSEAVKDGKNELVVRVEDDTEQFQLNGKQTLNPRGIWYTPVSGIWQTVWMEEVPRRFIEDLKIATDAAAGTITVQPIVGGQLPVKLEIRDGQNVVGLSQSTGEPITFKIRDPKLWSPDSPFLYDIVATTLKANELVFDRVESYAGIRSVGKTKDADGHWQFTLNGKMIFHWGPLDQGWWPDGLLTPPSDEAMLFDIEWLREAGFNMIRKHIKVEPRRYYYHCDRLGMMVWQDQVSGGAKPPWTRLKKDPVDAVWPVAAHDQFMIEFESMVSTLENHPSIVLWTPFNEAWGQHQTIEVGRWIAKRDPSRLVNIASGGNFWPAGDIVDEHRYPHPGFPFDLNDGGRFDDYIKVIGEFGGHGYPVQGHLWDNDRNNWGYGGLPKDEAEFKERYRTSINMLATLRGKGIAAGVYTQTTDVEGEINGLMTYDRKEIKIPANELAELHKVLFGAIRENADQAGKADQFKKSAFVEVPTDRKPGPVMDAETIRAGLQSHDRALFIKSGWIRDPYITLGPDDFYYLTGTQPNAGDTREATNPYNIGLGDESIVGGEVRVYRSKDLIDWESLGAIFDIEDTLYASKGQKRIWAPEVHWLPELANGEGRWALVHCPKQVSSLALTQGTELKGPWSHPMGKALGPRHDPSLFTDEDGSRYLLWGNTMVAPLNKELTAYTGKPVRIDPSSTRPGPDGKLINRIGHEGATMIKVGSKYVHLGTAWSTDRGRQGSYNLYYCVADQITGPYGPRKFAGRFLGHGTPFQDKDGKWWCTAFFNANVPPVPREGIQDRELASNAQTINEQGVTIVPLDVRMLEDGGVFIRAKDPDYANPGPDEAQQFGDR